MKQFVTGYYNILNDYLRAQLFYSALELDIFSFLDNEILVDDLAERTGYDCENLNWFLLCMVSENWIEKRDDFFVNTEETKKYLSSNGESFLGMALLSKKHMLDISSATALVKDGNEEKLDDRFAFSKVYPFKDVAQASANEIKLFRSEPFIRSIEHVFNPSQEFRFLDLGGGSGMLSIELCKHFQNAKGVVFEEKSVCKVAEEFIAKESLQGRISVQSGNFLTDDIGSGYDLIIASGIFHFAKNYLDTFVEKIALALSKNGYLYSVTGIASEDYLEPKGLLLKWLSSFLKGQNFLLNGDSLYQILADNNFKECDFFDEKFRGILYRKG